MSTAMQTAIRRILVGVGFLFGFLLMGQSAFAGIAGSKHDLTSVGAGNTYYVNGQGTAAAPAEICAFCHTPHGGLSSAPLWNRPSSAVSFTTYSSDTLDSETLAVGSISAACLSCHDGATALDLLINAPGSGGYNAGGASAGYSWNTVNVIGAGVTAIGAGGDLTDDHPIGVPYCGGVVTTAGNCNDKDFFLTNLNRKTGAVTSFGASAYLVDAAPGDQYWIDTGTLNNTREKTDLLLYVRTFAAGNQPSVECASCHEPHNGGAANTPFLRIANTTSNLCLTCHDK